ncbi:hypothetical protein F558DRAFT_04765 [Streptomyces sp. AmelKG-A3]|nr:hypothetical protein GA0115247_126715 [Streptomyces sp. PalvLS-984]SDD74809.1 hypothetical protein F558DRAFT_04765 [Streptomyces sp. AmelKG-A3]
MGEGLFELTVNAEPFQGGGEVAGGPGGSERRSPDPLSVPVTGSCDCWMTWVSAWARVCRSASPSPMTTWSHLRKQAPREGHERRLTRTTPPDRERGSRSGGVSGAAC